ncbi:hypothetical protein KP509_01G092500 [Ceratopteris richardii]|uniref:Secreted protein n=1 Tax=Ceratopteris richardii TaxID=49495 RepID=A0A8T2VNK0_CERRI|nr:hypothetical protein KP509_01G092500 [Ceratopteris richardii]
MGWTLSTLLAFLMKVAGSVLCEQSSMSRLPPLPLAPSCLPSARSLSLHSDSSIYFSSLGTSSSQILWFPSLKF